MPTVEKQTAFKKRRPKYGDESVDELFDQMVPVGEIKRGLTFALYGNSGTGKTRLATTFPKPINIIGAEDGTESIRKDKGVDFFKLRASRQIEGLCTGYKQGKTSKSMPGKKFQTVILDTGTMLQDLIYCEVTGIDKIPEQKDWGGATQEDWGNIIGQTKSYFRLLLDLADSGINIVFVCQERNFTENEDRTLLKPSIGSALSPSLTSWLHPACNYVAQTFIRRHKYLKEVKYQGKVKKEWAEHSKQKDFCLRTEVHDIYATKFRIPRGQTLPECIIDPSYEKIMRMIEGTDTK